MCGGCTCRSDLVDSSATDNTPSNPAFIQSSRCLHFGSIEGGRQWIFRRSNFHCQSVRREFLKDSKKGRKKESVRDRERERIGEWGRKNERSNEKDKEREKTKGKHTVTGRKRKKVNDQSPQSLVTYTFSYEIQIWCMVAKFGVYYVCLCISVRVCVCLFVCAFVCLYPRLCVAAT